jgi:hypothetical protein
MSLKDVTKSAVHLQRAIASTKRKLEEMEEEFEELESKRLQLYEESKRHEKEMLESFARDQIINSLYEKIGPLTCNKRMYIDIIEKETDVGLKMLYPEVPDKYKNMFRLDNKTLIHKLRIQDIDLINFVKCIVMYNRSELLFQINHQLTFKEQCLVLESDNVDAIGKLELRETETELARKKKVLIKNVFMTELSTKINGSYFHFSMQILATNVQSPGASYRSFNYLVSRYEVGSDLFYLLDEWEKGFAFVGDHDYKSVCDWLIPVKSRQVRRVKQLLPIQYRQISTSVDPTPIDFQTKFINQVSKLYVFIEHGLSNTLFGLQDYHSDLMTFIKQSVFE